MRGRHVLLAQAALALSLTACGSATDPPVALRQAATPSASPSPAASPAPTRVSPVTPSATSKPVAPPRPRASTLAPRPTRSALPAGEVALPHWTSDSIPAAQLTGVQVTDAGGCVWLRASDGKRRAALWPEGYRARFAPLRIYDERDRLVWSAGQVRTISGGSSSVYVERLPAACRTGQYAWWVGPIT